MNRLPKGWAARPAPLRLNTNPRQLRELQEPAPKHQPERNPGLVQGQAEESWERWEGEDE